MALAYVPGKSPDGANRHWASGTIAIQFTGPTTVDGHAVHDGVRNAMASWNAIAHARIVLTAAGTIDRREPAIGNGKNEFGWVESSDNPYFIPGVPCTTATIYDALTGVISEADTTCNAMAFQWPDDLFGLETQNDVVDAESAALAAFGSWLGLDTSLEYGDPMFPVLGSGSIRRWLFADEFAFGRHQYGDGTSSYGSISGTVRFADGSPVPYADVLALGGGGQIAFGAVADASGAYTIHEMPAGSYIVVTRPLTTDPYIVTSVPYRGNPIHNLDFTPTYYGGGLSVQVANGSTTPGIGIAVIRSGSQPDVYEPNDTASAASPLALGFSKLATTHTALDSDWFWFQTSANTCYVVGTGFHGASIVPTPMGGAFWSRTRLALYDGASLMGQNESRDEPQLDPRNWLTFCETGAGRRIDLQVTQREPVGGAGFFYAVFVHAVVGGAARSPVIDALYPSSGWSNRNRFVWIDGADFLPGASVEIRLPSATWVAASPVIATQCDTTYRCGALKALFPPGTPGSADVKVTNPNGRSITKTAAFTYLAYGSGPFDDRTPQAFGTRYGQGKAVCVGDYDGDGSDDILKTRTAGLPYQLFRSNGNDTFSDVAASAGLHLESSSFGSSCSFVDVDDDGDLDAYITNVAYMMPSGASNALYKNQLAESGSPTFVLATPAGLGGTSTRYKSDAAWADYDKDGRLDLVLAYDSYAGGAPYADALQHFRQNANGSFTEDTATSGLSGYVASVTSVKAADFNNDGCEDLAVFSHAGLANKLFKGNCHGSFSDFTLQSHVADGAPWCRGVAVADFNNDGKTDIFCGTYNAGAAPIRPRLWLNNGDATFTDRASGAGLYSVARNMDVVLPLDEDNDGFTDVYIGASESGWPDDRKDVLLRNSGGSPPAFTDVTDAAGMYPTTQDGTGLCGTGVDEYYCDRDAAAGGVLDRSADGALDVFVTGDDPDGLQRGTDFLWVNGHNTIADGSTAPGNDWIGVALEGANTKLSRVLSNRVGLGARVTVIPRFNLPAGAVPTETQCLQNPLPNGVTGTTREVVAGNRSQSSTVLHFGLGNSMPFGQKRVDCIKVVWPSGLERAYTGIVANTKVVLAEDAGRMKIIQIVPNSGPNNRSDPTTITGLRFDRDVVSVPQVFFGAVPAVSVAFVSEHELTVLPPLWQPPGTVDVTVVNTDGERDTLLAGYSYTGLSAGVRFKDPVPSMTTVTGSVPNDPNFVATRGVERTGAIADGVTELVFEADVGGPGRVRFVLDEDDDPSNGPPPGTSVGAATSLGGGAPLTTLIVPVTLVAGGRYVGQAVYTAPHDFIRTDADKPLASRPIRVRATFIDASNAEYALPTRSLDLYRVPVLYVHGMWGGLNSFEWPILDDARWIIHRGIYSATNDVGFAQNVEMAPRVVAELRKKINDLGIAGTRFVVIGHSMGAVLFKIYMSGTGAPYARADNFLAGDVYALISVDAPFFGSYFASHVRSVQSSGPVGALFTRTMRSVGLAVDRGCMASLDPQSPDILGIPSTGGTFHAIVGWGGREMRDLGATIAADNKLAIVQSVLALYNFGFENYIVRCGSGDDFIVCTESQQGSLASSFVSDFHFENLSAKAIHLDSICNESAPSAAVDRLLNTPTMTGAEWGHVLLAATPPATGVGFLSPSAPGSSLAIGTVTPATGSSMGGYPITIAGAGFDSTIRVKIGSFYASHVVAVDGNTLTFRATPGEPGGTTVTVVNGAGQSASAMFTYTDPGPVPGGVTLTVPVDGAYVVAGSTVSVAAIGWGGFTIAGGLVSSEAFSSDDDHDSGDAFATEVSIPAEFLGPLTIELVAKDVNSNFKATAPVTITVVAPGNVALTRIDAEKATLLEADPSRQLHVYGFYSDGVRREVSHATGILYEMDTQDPRKPNYPYNGTGVAVVDAGGKVTAKAKGSTVCHITYGGRTIDVVIEVAGIRPTVTLQKPGFISWPYQGLGVTYDVVRGELSGLRATGGNFAHPSVGVTCFKDNFANVTAADASNPPAGAGYFYLMRDSRTLSYDESPFWATRSQNGQRTGEIDTIAGGCP